MVEAFGISLSTVAIWICVNLFAIVESFIVLRYTNRFMIALVMLACLIGNVVVLSWRVQEWLKMQGVVVP